MHAMRTTRSIRSAHGSVSKQNRGKTTQIKRSAFRGTQPINAGQQTSTDRREQPHTNHTKEGITYSLTTPKQKTSKNALRNLIQLKQRKTRKRPPTDNTCMPSRCDDRYEKHLKNTSPGCRPFLDFDFAFSCSDTNSSLYTHPKMCAYVYAYVGRNPPKVQTAVPNSRENSIDTPPPPPLPPPPLKSNHGTSYEQQDQTIARRNNSCREEKNKKQAEDQNKRARHK